MLETGSRRRATLVWFGVSLVLALAAAWGARLYMAQASATKTVVVATRAIAPMSVIAATDLALAPRPVGMVPPDALTEVADAVGRFTTYGFLPSDMIRGHALLSERPDTASPLTAKLTEIARRAQDEGLRAVPLALDAEHGFNLAQVGDRVDLIGVGVKSGATLTTVVVAQGVELMAKLPDVQTSGIDVGPAPEEMTKGVAVVVVDPLTAERVVTAASLGRIWMVLDPAGVSEAPPVPAITDDVATWGIAGPSESLPAATGR